MPTRSFKLTSNKRSRTVDTDTAAQVAIKWIKNAKPGDKITFERTDNEDLLELFGIGGDEEVEDKA